MPPTTRRASSSRAAEDLWATVTHVTQAVIRSAREKGRGLGLSLPQMFLLSGLEEMGEIPCARWAEQMGASASATTSLLDGLESQGFLTRTHDRTDRRQVLISLTPKGRRLARKLHHDFGGFWASICADIPVTDLERATTVLQRIAERLADDEGPPVVHRQRDPLIRGR